MLQDATAEERLATTFRALSTLGFKALPKRAGARRFAKGLRLSQGTVELELVLTDVDFLEYPKIRLREKPPFLPKLMPHVDATGSLCYLAKGTAVLDRYDPAGSIALCVEHAEKLLMRIADNPKKALEEAQDEFLAYWAVGEFPVAARVLIGDLSFSGEPAYFRITDGAKSLWLISKNVQEVKGIGRALSRTEYSQRSSTCWTIESKKKPIIVPEGLPKNVGELFAWLKTWDPTVYKTIAQRLEHDKEYLKQKSLILIVVTPYGSLGAMIRLEPLHRLGLKSSPDKFKQYLHTKGQQTPIVRLKLDEVGTTFIHSRNLPTGQQDLAGKRISLIGCGAIGGYMAQALIRLGAGSGPKGRLTLYDADEISAGNLGRHYLGLNHLDENKAEAARNELLRQFPLANIEAVTKPANPTVKLFEEHLIINATGEEALSEMLNEHHARRLKKSQINTGAMLHLWIKGAGDCVQAIWVDSPKYGCFRCLKLPKGAPGKTERHPVLKSESPIKFVGCHAVTPYTVAASMSAAVLGMEMIAGWLQGGASPRFRTVAVQKANVYKLSDKDLEPIKGCPACSTN